MWFQKEIQLGNYARGFHLITEDVLRQIPELKRLEVGLLHDFIKHTSASLTLNENADSSVRDDFESFINHLVPEEEPYYTHTYECSDDMPAHLKSSLLGASVTIPISKGRMNLGTWQGLYLCEHRDGRHRRQLVLTLQGE